MILAISNTHTLQVRSNVCKVPAAHVGGPVPEGSRSTFFCQKKVLFLAKKKYFFLQIKVLFFAKKKYFFLQKKVLLCSDMITFHAVQCITRGAPKPPPRLSGPGLDVLEQQGQQDAVINKDNVIITNRSGR